MPVCFIIVIQIFENCLITTLSLLQETRSLQGQEEGATTLLKYIFQMQFEI